MKDVGKYLEYLEDLKKENITQKERRKSFEQLIIKSKKILRNMESNLELVSENDLKIILEKIEEVELNKTLINFRNIKIVSKYFDNERFMSEPQVLLAKDSLNELKKVILKFINALEKLNDNIKLVDDKVIEQQICLINKILKKEQLLSSELKVFYDELMKCNDESIDINQIIMDVSIYLNDLISKQVKEKNNDVITVNSSAYGYVKEDNNDKIIKMNNLTNEELEKIGYYKDVINKILEIGKKYHIENFSGLELFVSLNDDAPIFSKEIYDIFNVELNYDNIKVLEEFNDIVVLEQDIRYLVIDEFLIKLRDVLQKLDVIFIHEEENEHEEEEIINILNNPQSLVVFLPNNKSGKSFVEEDYAIAQKVDRIDARLAVKQLKNFYTKHVEPRRDRQDSKNEYNGIKLLHADAGRRGRCFYLNMSVSEEVKLFLRQTYGTDEVYLYTGVVNIGNHEESYADGQYNRMKNKYKDIMYIMNLFNNKLLTDVDKREICEFIEAAMDITKKLNGIERKKKYE